MCDAQPPESPQPVPTPEPKHESASAKPSPPPKPGWFARLLALGEHNKATAVATLLTIVTGLWFVVSKAVDSFAGDDAKTAAEATQDAIDQAVAAALAKWKVDAGAAAIAGRTAPVGGLGSMLAAGAAIERLGQEAARPEATEAERKRILDAFRDFALGRPEAALEELAGIARAQEARGALPHAAETWRQRASLQRYTDATGALADYRHAASLAPAGADALLETAALQFEAGDMDGACQTTRQARAAARVAGDRVTLVDASLFLGIQSFPSWGQDPEYAAEKSAAVLEAAALTEALVVEAPRDMDYARMRVRALYDWAEMQRRAREDAEPQIAQLQALGERLAALELADAAARDRDFALFVTRSREGNFFGMSGMYLRPMGPSDWARATPAYEAALTLAARLVEEAGADPEVLVDIWGQLSGLAAFVENLGGPPELLDRALPLFVASLERLLELAPDNAEFAVFAASARNALGRRMIERGEVEDGIEVVRASLAGIREVAPRHPDPAMGRSVAAAVHIAALKVLPESARALAQESLRECRALLELLPEESPWYGRASMTEEVAALESQWAAAAAEGGGAEPAAQGEAG